MEGREPARTAFDGCEYGSLNYKEEARSGFIPQRAFFSFWLSVNAETPPWRKCPVPGTF